MNDQSENFLNNLSEKVDATFEPFFVFPGQNVTEAITLFKKNISIGDGLIQNGNIIRSTVAGILRYRQPVSYWVCSYFAILSILSF